MSPSLYDLLSSRDLQGHSISILVAVYVMTFTAFMATSLVYCMDVSEKKISYFDHSCNLTKTA